MYIYKQIFRSMKIVIKQFKELSINEYHQITQARERVFYLEQHVSCLDADDIDPHCTYLYVEQAGQIIGFLRMIPAGIAYEEVSIGRVLVCDEFRREGICRKMMQTAIDYIQASWRTSHIKISAQAYLVDFYKSLGFTLISEAYLEAGITHYKMLRS